MKIVKIDPENPANSAISLAKSYLEKDGLIIYPTDTAYGIGVNAFQKRAIEKLYEVKKRSRVKPTHVVIRDWQMIKDITYVNGFAKKLYDAFLPGPLSMILTKKNRVPGLLTANLQTLGVRLPDCAFTKKLSGMLNFPYTTPSANRQGEKTPYSIAEVSKVLDVQKVDLIIDAGQLRKKDPSTIVDLTGKRLKTLRHGPIEDKEIKKAIQSYST